MQSCKVFPLSSDVRGNDTLAVARIPGLPGSGKYLLSDVAPDIFTGAPVGVTLHVKLAAFDAAAVHRWPQRRGLASCDVYVADPSTVTRGGAGGLSGIDFEKGKLIGVPLLSPERTRTRTWSTFGAPHSLPSWQRCRSASEHQATWCRPISASAATSNHPPVAICKDVTATTLSDDSIHQQRFVRSRGREPLNCTQAPAGPFGPGTTPVTLSCTDVGA